MAVTIAVTDCAQPFMCIAFCIYVFHLQPTLESRKRFLTGNMNHSECVLERQIGSSVKKLENKVRIQWLDVTYKVTSTIRSFFHSFNEYLLSYHYLPGTRVRVGYTKAKKREKFLTS